MSTHTVLALVGPTLTESLDDNDPSVRELGTAQGVKFVTWGDFEGNLVKASDICGVVVCGPAPVNTALLDKLPHLKVVSNYGVGVDHIDRRACRERNIPVGNTPDVLSDATADLGWTLLMAAARRVVEADAFTRSAGFDKYYNMIYLGKDITGATLGIVGMGRIGGEVARRAAGFRMNVLYCNRSQRRAEHDSNPNPGHT